MSFGGKVKGLKFKGGKKMAHSDTFEKERAVRRCLFEIATFDSVDFKTLSSERLQRFLLLSKQYSAYSHNPEYKGIFSKLVAVYDISPHLSERIEKASNLDLSVERQDAEAYFNMLKEEEFNAMMQMRYEMYLRSLNRFKESYIKLFDTAKTYTNDVRQLTNRVFMNGATEKERQEALRQIYAKDPMLAWSIIKDKYKDNVPKAFLPFMPPQKVADLLQKGKLKKEGLSNIYAINPMAVVQALDEAYTQKGLPIPPQFRSFSKLPAGYESVAGNIFVGPIQIDKAMIERAMHSKTQLENQTRKTAEDAKKLDAEAKQANVPSETYQEDVLKNTSSEEMSDAARAVVEGVLSEDDISQLKTYASQMVSNVGINEAKEVDAQGLEALNNASVTPSKTKQTETAKEGDAQGLEALNNASVTPSKTKQTETAKGGEPVQMASNQKTSEQDTAFVFVPDTKESGAPVSSTDVADMDISLMGDGVDIFVQNQKGDILPLDMNMALNQETDMSAQLAGVDVTQHLQNSQLTEDDLVDVQALGMVKELGR